jgi:hypothetical protein
MADSVESTRRAFRTAISASRFARLEDHLLSLLRPVLWIERDSDSPRLGQSKFGGWPDLPPNSVWPTHSGGPHQFIAQFNFTEMPLFPDIVLPRDGLLCLFAATRPLEHVSWCDQGYLQGHCAPSSKNRVRTSPPPPSPMQHQERLADEQFVRELEERHAKEVPQGLRWPREPKKAIPEEERQFAIRFVAGLDFPQSVEQRDDWPNLGTETACDYFDELADIWSSVAPLGSNDHLLGYPGQSSLAYDPTPGPSWSHLLCLSSHDDLEWCWHDGDYLHVFVEHERLRRADFSNLLAQ